MRKAIIPLIILLIYAYPSFAEPEPQKPIGDFLDGTVAKYHITFKALSKNYKVDDAVVSFEKTGDDTYRAKFSLNKKFITYNIETTGFIHNNQIYPQKVTARYKFLIFNYTLKYKYYYDENYNVIKIYTSSAGDTGYPTEKDIVKFPNNYRSVDLLSGIFQLIYLAYYDQELVPLNMIHADYALWGLQVKSFQKDGEKYIKFKDKKQEEDFKLKNLLVKMNENGWPEQAWVDEFWILKNLKFTLVEPK